MTGFGFMQEIQKRKRLYWFLGTSLLAIICISCGGGGGGGSSNDRSSSDAQAPSTPGFLTVTPVSPESITISWSASTDNVGVTSYKIYRDENLIRTVTEIERIESGIEIDVPANTLSVQNLNNGLFYSKSEKIIAVETTDAELSTIDTVLAAATTYTDVGLTENTNYCYAVSAVDAAGNESDRTADVCNTTPRIGCGSGLPLAVTDTTFPSVVDSGSTVDGSAAYEGSFEDIVNPLMAALYPVGDSTTITMSGAPVTASDCRISFRIVIPADVSGTATTCFRLIDYDDGLTFMENIDNNAVSNDFCQEVTIN